MSLNENLIKMRQAVNLSQKEVSEKLGYSTPQFISNWERGISTPPVSVIKKLSKIYKINPDEIFHVLLEIYIHDARTKLMRQYERSK